MRAEHIKQLLETHGVRGYLALQAKLLGLREDGTAPTDSHGKVRLKESITLPNGRTEPRRSPRDFSIKALFEAMIGDVDYHTGIGIARSGGFVEAASFKEAVSTGAFPSAVGQLIATEVISGYEDDGGFIGDMLVRTMQSNLRGERVVGFTASQAPLPVGEGEPYVGSSLAEKYMGTRETKRGRLVEVTEEAVFFDQTGQLLDRAQNIGYAARQDRERRIVWGVLDHDSDNDIYQPDGTAEQLYSSGNNNLDTSTGALSDWTDIQSVMDYHATNVTDDRQADDTDGAQPLVWMPRILLTSMEIAMTAKKIIRATTTTNNNTDAPNDPMIQQMTPLSSPFVNAATAGDRWDDNSDWLLGDFQRQFRYKEIWPLQTFRDNSGRFDNDTIARFKVREYGDVLALDERWVIKVDVT